MDNPRRRRFKAWYAAHYTDDAAGRAKFMRDSAALGYKGLTKGRVSQYFDERQPFGELAGRNVALRFGLKEDFFERDAARSRGGSDSEPAGGNSDSRTIDDAYRDGRGWFDGVEMTHQECELLAIFRQLRAPARKVMLEALRSTRDSAEHEAEALQERLQQRRQPVEKRPVR